MISKIITNSTTHVTLHHSLSTFQIKSSTHTVSSLNQITKTLQILNTITVHGKIRNSLKIKKWLNSACTFDSITACSLLISFYIRFNSNTSEQKKRALQHNFLHTLIQLLPHQSTLTHVQNQQVTRRQNGYCFYNCNMKVISPSQSRTSPYNS